MSEHKEYPIFIFHLHKTISVIDCNSKQIRTNIWDRSIESEISNYKSISYECSSVLEWIIIISSTKNSLHRVEKEKWLE